MDKRFLAILGVIVALFLGLILWNSRSTNTPTSAVSPSNHVTGKLDSKVSFVEYGDFQCNACEYYNTTVDAVRKKYADTVKFQFRNLPLSSLHPNAIGGARAAEAASKQGKFWEMHDLLYLASNWSVWTTATDPNPSFESYARQLGLNIEQYRTDFKSAAVNDIINADMAAFDKTGAEKATPSFFVNGKQISLDAVSDAKTGPSLEKFSAILDKALAEAK